MQGGVTMKKIGWLIVGFLLITGCEKLSFLKPKSSKKVIEKPATYKPKGEPIAKVNNIVVTLDELNEDIENYNAAVVKDRPELKIDTREKKINYLKNEVIRPLILYEQALDRGLDKKEEVIKALEKTKRDLLVVELIKEETQKINVTSKEIEEYYKRFEGEFKEPEERRIREIVVLSQKEATDILIRLLQGEDFATLARDYSKSPTASKGGDLGFIKKGTKFPQFDSIAFSGALTKGSISNIFKGPEGYYIIKVEDIKGGKQKTLSEMWDDIKRALIFIKQQQKIENIINEASKRYSIEIYEDKVK
jgi:parvulin-like peptidyl-prolyl isomerase